MQVEIRHNPSFALARCMLAPNEPMRAESGAMSAMSPDVGIAAQMEGGVMRSLKRSVLGGESLFVTAYTAGPMGGWVDVAASLPGDLLTLPVSVGQDWNLSRGSWLANEHSVTIDTTWGGFGNPMGGEGGFLVRATGPGDVLAHSRNPQALLDYLTARLPFTRA
ncbi:MAG: AIM24 family protein [Geodermatophilaceae bacterium]|nr:AIM24 family protein [Geodermatophilaceae bacterium]